MSYTRSYFVEMIQKSNEETMQKCRESKHCLRDEGKRARIFDHFPCLLPQRDIDAMRLELKKIFDNIKFVDEIEHRYHLTNHVSQEMIHEWYKNIIKIGCSELLNNDGWIKQEIIDLLEWKETLSQKAISDIMGAYVCAVNQAIFKDYSHNRPHHIMAAILHFINENYDKWAKEELTKTIFPLSSFEVEDNSKKPFLAKISQTINSNRLFTRLTQLDDKEEQKHEHRTCCYVQ